MTLVSYEYVEKPIRHASWLQTPRRAIPVFLGLIALLWWGDGRLFANARHISLSVVNRNRDDWFGPRVTPAQAGGWRVEARRLELIGDGLGQALTPFDCGAPSAPALFAIGDSHALVYRTMLSEYARRTGAPVRLYSAPCGFPRIILPRSDCTAIDASVIADVRRRAMPGDVVFLPSLRVPRFRDQWDTREHDTAAEWRAAEESFDTAVNKSVTMLQAMAGPGVHIVFELPKPIFRIPLFRCADWFNRLNPACAGGSNLDRTTLLDYRRPVLAFADALRSRVDGFSTWDPFPGLCPSEVCSMWRDGRPLFFDGDHVTYFANMLLADDFIAAMREVALESPPVINSDSAPPTRRTP